MVLTIFTFQYLHNYRMALSKFLCFFYFFVTRGGLCRLLMKTNQETLGCLMRAVYTSATGTHSGRHCLYRVDLEGPSAPQLPSVLALWDPTAPSTPQQPMEAEQSSPGSMAGSSCSVGISPACFLLLHFSPPCIFAHHLFKHICCMNTPLFKVFKIIQFF